jgi:hypothetical protein
LTENLLLGSPTGEKHAQNKLTHSKSESDNKKNKDRKVAFWHISTGHTNNVYKKYSSFVNLKNKSIILPFFITGII